MSKELQSMKQLQSDVEKIKTAQTYQQYEPVVKCLQNIKQYMNETQTIEGAQYLPELVSTTLNHVMNHKQYPDQILIHIEQFIKSVLLYIYNNIFDDKISVMFCKIMDPSCMIYEYNDLSIYWHDNMIAYSYNQNPEYKQFIDNLKVGSKIDCIRICQITNRMNWSRGIIEKKNEEQINVRFLNEHSNFQLYNIKRGQLMPYLTRSKNLDSILNLQKKQVLLAALNDKWILSTILNRTESQDLENIVTYTIGFRCYSAFGENMEYETQQKFTGLNNCYDEQITAFSPRLALCGSHVARRYNSNEQFVDDSYDNLYECDYQQNKFYGILRPRYSKSMLLIKFINYFGSIGGFEQILTLQSVDILANYIYALGNLHAQFYRLFCKDYVPKLQGLRQTLIQYDEQALRNLGRQKINIILQAFNLLLDRIMIEDQRKEWIQSLGLEFVQICFRCKFLEKKIIGLKLLTDLLKQAYNDQSPKLILQWIEKQGIFENLFHHSTHLQLLERTKDLIKIYLTIEDALEIKYLQMVWNLMQSNDNEVRQIIFKLFNDIAPLLSDQQIYYFLELIKDLRQDLILIEHVQFLFEMHKNRYNQQFLYTEAIETLWSIIEYAELQKKAKLEDQSLIYIIELIKQLEVNQIKTQMLQKLIFNIKQQKVESSSLKILQQIMCKFLSSNRNNNILLQEEEDQKEFIKKFIQQQKIHDTLRDSIENLHNQNIGINKDDVNEINKYINKLQERLLLINTLIMINGTAADMIDQQFLDLIWNKHILNPIINQESEIVSCWFRELIEKDENFSAKQLDDFFQRLLTQNNKLTQNAFKCFKQILYYVNQKDYRIQRQSLMFKQLCDQYGNLLSMENLTVQEKDDLMEFKIMVDVHQIIGINYLWHIVLNSQLDQAIKLLVKLNLSQQEQFIEQIVDKLISNDDQIIFRCLSILRELLNETETLGIGTLLPLDSMVKGNQFNINLISDMIDRNQSNKVTVRVYRNTTIFELRKLVAKEIKIGWEQIKLIRNGIVVLDTDNGKTLKQLNIKKREVMHVTRRNTKPIPKMLLVENNHLSSKFLKVLEDLFNQYSSNGKMNLEQLTQFGIKASPNQNVQQGQKIQQIFDQFSTEGQFLTLDNFIQFFEDCCLKQQGVQDVWWNLYAFGYKNDLTLINQDNYEIDESKLPRYQLAQNQKFQEIMFKYFRQNDKVAQESWKLFCSLPIQPILDKVKLRAISFEDMKNDVSYQLIYSLRVIENLLQDKDYCRYFIISKGLNFLLSILNILEQQDGIIKKQGQQIILNIFIKHITALFSSRYDKIFYIQKNVKQPLSVTLDVIGQFIVGGYLSQQDNTFIESVQETEEFLQIAKFTSDLNVNLDFNDLLKYLISTSLDINEDRKVIEYVLKLFTIIIGLNLGNCSNFFIEEIQQIKSRYKQFLFASKQLLTQKYTINSLYLIYKYQKNKLGKFMIQLLKDLFPSNDNKDSESYFDLLAKIIIEEKYCDKELANNIIQQLDNYEPNESRLTLQSDKTLTGLLSILESLCMIDSSILTSELIKYLYTVHLFCFNLISFQLSPQKQVTHNYVKSKSPESRKVVYRIIILYFKQNFNLQDIDLSTVIFQTQLYVGFDIKVQPRSFNGYVGIRNLGCICYMNSMMQQFFMTPEFRYCMMRAEDGVDENIIAIKDNNSGFEQYIDDNPIHQFQKMLAYLDQSERSDFNPFFFCTSYKDKDNKPVEFQLQQDAQEFLNHFFDSLDNQLRNKGWQQFVEAIYGGQLCSQMICNECQFMREKFDLFYTLSLKVKDVKSINESFESMINGEVIKDYYCEKCQQKQDLIKRQCLSKLPNVLIVHLQRIEFNLDLYMNEKLSSQLEFPQLLNLSKYTREALSTYEFKHDTYYQYKLKGVVVHQGTASQGHYYSLINTQDEKWLKFNDSIIEEFDIKYLPQECFGGNYSEKNQVFKEIGSSTNAYILVYERIQKEQIELKFSNLQQKFEIMSKFESVVNQYQDSNLEIKIDYQIMSQQYISEQLYGEIWLDNHRLMLERHVYSDEFFRFVKEIAEIFPFPSDYGRVNKAEKLPEFFGIYNNYQQVQNVEQIGKFLYNLTYITIELLSRSLDHNSIKDYVLVIINLINIIPCNVFNIFQNIFITRQQRVFDVLLFAPDPQVRQAIQQIMLHYLNVIIYIYNLMLNTSYKNEQDLNSVEEKLDYTIVTFLLNFLHRLYQDVPNSHIRSSQYFNFWKQFVKSSQINLFFANQIELISILVDFYMDKQEALDLRYNQFYEFKHKEKSTVVNTNLMPNYSYLLQCLNYLLKSDYYQLTKNDKTCLQSTYFYSKAISECYDLEAIQSIIQKMALDNLILSKEIIEIILNQIYNANHENIGQYLKLAEGLLNLYDTIQKERIQWLLGYPQPNYSDNYATGCQPNLSQQCISYLSHIGCKNETISILNQLFFNQKAQKNSAVQMIRMLLSVMNQNKHVFSYIIQLPPPSYLYSKYTDWFEKFLNDYQEDYFKNPTMTDSIFFNHQLELEQTIQLWQEFQRNFQNINSLNIYNAVQPIYILGNTIQTEQVFSQTYIHNIILETQESLVYFVESNPTLVSNEAFPPQVLTNNIYIQTSYIETTSDIFCIIKNEEQIKPCNEIEENIYSNQIEENIYSNEIGFNEQQQVNDDFINELQNNPISQQNVFRQKQIDNQNYYDKRSQQEQQNIQCIMKLEVGKLLKRFMIHNQTDQTFNIVFQIIQQPNNKINFILPKIVIKQIPPYNISYLTSIMKINPFEEWGTYDLNLDINSLNSINQNQPQQQIQQKDDVRGQEQSFTPIEKLSLTKNDSQINCPECTFLQSSSNNYCEMCQINFK